MYDTCDFYGKWRSDLACELLSGVLAASVDLDDRGHEGCLEAEAEGHE